MITLIRLRALHELTLEHFSLEFYFTVFPASVSSSGPLTSFRSARILEKFIKQTMQNLPLRMDQGQIGSGKRVDHDGVGH